MTIATTCLSAAESIDFGHWYCRPREIPHDFFGFVYIIQNLSTGRKYIGKKQRYSASSRRLKGKKNKKHFKKESDWREYCGSCKELLKDIEICGKSNFSFEIIKFCSSKSDLAYSEAKLQFDNDVLLREDFYNGIINVRIGKIRT